VRNFSIAVFTVVVSAQTRISVRQMSDLNAGRRTPAMLVLAQNCSSTYPCLVRFGSRVVSLLQSASVTLGGTVTGNSIAYIYVAPSGLLTVGHNAPAGNTVMCSIGCTVFRGLTQFPEDSVPLFTWSMTWTGGTGAWDAAGGRDMRAFLGTKTVTAGPGIQITDVMGESVVAVNSTLVGTRVAVPASSTSNCTPPAFALNPTHLYICYQANLWARIATTAF